MSAQVQPDAERHIVRLRLPAEAIAELLATLADEVRHGGTVAVLLDDLATTARNLEREPSERDMSWDAACLAHDLAVGAILAELPPVVWEMPSHMAAVLAARLTQAADAASLLVHCTACERLTYWEDAVWEARELANSEPFCSETCRETFVERQLEAAAERQAT